MARSERRVFVRSGELIVGVLDRATHGPDSWSWFLTGVSRPHDIWQGYADTEDAAFDDFASCWKRWLDWAGLEQVGILERGGEAMNKRARRSANYDRRLARCRASADARSW
jgi:hypothetical protein